MLRDVHECPLDRGAALQPTVFRRETHRMRRAVNQPLNRGHGDRADLRRFRTITAECAQPGCQTTGERFALGATAMKRVLALLSIAVCTSDLSGQQSPDPLPSWNESAAKRALTSFVSRVTTAGSPEFVNASERIGVRQRRDALGRTADVRPALLHRRSDQDTGAHASGVANDRTLRRGAQGRSEDGARGRGARNRRATDSRPSSSREAASNSSGRGQRRSTEFLECAESAQISGPNHSCAGRSRRRAAAATTPPAWSPRTVPMTSRARTYAGSRPDREHAAVATSAGHSSLFHPRSPWNISSSG
jgi:hypothetical protein